MSSQQQIKTNCPPQWQRLKNLKLKTAQLPSLLETNPGFVEPDTPIKVKDVSNDFVEVKFVDYPKMKTQYIKTSLFPALVICSDQDREDVFKVFPNLFENSQLQLDSQLGGINKRPAPNDAESHDSEPCGNFTARQRTLQIAGQQEASEPLAYIFGDKLDINPNDIYDDGKSEDQSPKIPKDQTDYANLGFLVKYHKDSNTVTVKGSSSAAEPCQWVVNQVPTCSGDFLEHVKTVNADAYTHLVQIKKIMTTEKIVSIERESTKPIEAPQNIDKNEKTIEYSSAAFPIVGPLNYLLRNGLQPYPKLDLEQISGFCGMFPAINEMFVSRVDHQ